MKDTTSPQTKSFVIHLTGIREQCSPSTKRISLPRIMYIEAANSAGATNRRRVCKMNGPKVVLSKWDIARPMYPIVSTFNQPYAVRGKEGPGLYIVHQQAKGKGTMSWF